jgi:hypothetical protein
MFSIDTAFSGYLRGPELLGLVLYKGEVQELGQQDLEGGETELVSRIHVSLVLKGLCHKMNNFVEGLNKSNQYFKKPSAPVQKVLF